MEPSSAALHNSDILSLFAKETLKRYLGHDKVDNEMHCKDLFVCQFKTSAKVASEVVKENVEIAPPSPYANNDTFDATNDEFNDDYNEDVTDEVLEEKDDLVQINVEDIKEDSETQGYYNSGWFNPEMRSCTAF